MQGPRIRVLMSCFDCDFCARESYTYQGDSGSDVYCVHPEAAESGKIKRLIGDTNWKTPVWCPLRQAAIDKMVSELSNQQN
jgi:hypothetical protein